jgi:hypothetical protein
MIAANEHQARGGAAMKFRHKVVVERLSRLRRVSGVEDIAGDQDHIHLELYYLLEEPVQEELLLLLPGLLVEHLTQVPIGGVQDSKGIGRLITHKVTV